MKTYNIEDKVWYAERKSVEERVACPECFGKKYLTVILGDDSQVTINCAGCASGYDPPKGYVTYRKQDIDVSLVTICKVEIYRDHVEYGFNCSDNCHRIGKDIDFALTVEDAKIRAQKLAEEWNEQKLADIHCKEKNNRTWSWHVYYYRKMIRDAKTTIEDATRKLHVAKTHE